MELKYTPSLTGLTIVTDPDTQRNLVFGEGHPKFLIPDFNPDPTDIWISYQDYIESKYGPIYDQNGGDIVSYLPIDNSGLMKVEYVLNELSLESDEDNYKEYVIFIEGYVVSDGYFLATKVTGDL